MREHLFGGPLACLQRQFRPEQHGYQFQFGRGPFDPNGPSYSESAQRQRLTSHAARTTTLDELGLEKERVIGYWFQFGDNWWFAGFTTWGVIPVNRHLPFG